MSGNAASWLSSPSPDPASLRHCPEAEYRAFVTRLEVSEEGRRKQFNFYLRFAHPPA